ATATAARSPGEPGRRGPARSVIWATHSAARESATMRSRSAAAVDSGPAGAARPVAVSAPTATKAKRASVFKSLPPRRGMLSGRHEPAHKPRAHGQLGTGLVEHRAIVTAFIRPQLHALGTRLLEQIG